MSSIFWLLVVLILSFIEVSTVNLVCIWFVASGIITLILSFFIEDFILLSTIFIILGIIFLILSRPIVKKLKSKTTEKTNLERIIGSTGVVTEDILKNSIGEVKVDGKRWSALSKVNIEKGTLVKVLRIDGVKLIVEKESE